MMACKRDLNPAVSIFPVSKMCVGHGQPCRNVLTYLASYSLQPSCHICLEYELGHSSPNKDIHRPAVLCTAAFKIF
jgi:hypothetical protein